MTLLGVSVLCDSVQCSCAWVVRWTLSRGAYSRTIQGMDRGGSFRDVLVGVQKLVYSSDGVDGQEEYVLL